MLSREQLLDHVWGFDFDPGSNVVDVYVGYLRRKLGADRDRDRARDGLPLQQLTCSAGLHAATRIAAVYRVFLCSSILKGSLKLLRVLNLTVTSR